MQWGGEASAFPENVNRWAVIVGISEYRDSSLNLDYAHHDAEELYKLIRTPQGGAFDEDHIVKLINKDATYANLKKALRTFLKKPASDDIVLIYFACHGAPDPERPSEVYLITHDTDPKDIASTGLPMSELEDSLRVTLNAERVILLADACHSAAAAGGDAKRRSMIGEAAVFNRYLQTLSESRKGMAVLTSAEANESSLEDVRWGGGHGVFTYHLLQGMQGKAADDSGVVRVGALFDYVSDLVRKDTGDQQHPVIGSAGFDRDLPLAITGEISVNDHFLLGRHLYNLGWQLADKRRFESAQHQLEEALRLASLFGEPLPEARLYLGLAALAVGDLDSARRAFEETEKAAEGALLADARFYRAVVLAKMKDAKGAIAAIEDFVTEHASDWRCAWLGELKTILAAQMHPGPARALLVGIEKYVDPTRNLRGPANDVALVKNLLIEKCGIAEENVMGILDSAATGEGIVDALAALKDQSQPDDSVLIWYSGHAFPDSQQGTYLVPHDFDSQNPDSTISAEKLHELITAIPARSKTVVLDTHLNPKLVELARRDRGYALLLAEDSPKSQAAEASIDGRYFGVFTYELVQALTKNLGAPLAKVKEQVEQGIAARKRFAQRPLFVCNKDDSFLMSAGTPADWLEAFDFALRRSYSDLTLDELKAIDTRLYRSQKATYPPLYQSLGRGYLEKEAFGQALQTLQKAHQYAGKIGALTPELLLVLVIAQVRMQQYSEALQTLQDHASTASKQATHLQEAASLLSALPGSKLHALLVGVSKHKDAKLVQAQGALNDVAAMKRLLINHLGTDEANVDCLNNEDATREAIIAKFKGLVQRAEDGPALFFFAGNGSLDLEKRPTILSYDARQARIPNDITLAELSAIAGYQPTNLVSVIDAGWAPGMKLPWGASWGSRYIDPDPRRRPASRGLGALAPDGDYEASDAQSWQPDAAWRHARATSEQALTSLRIGRVSLYPVAIQQVFGQESLDASAAIVESEFPSPFGEEGRVVRGALTTALIKAVVELTREPSSQQDPEEGAVYAPRTGVVTELPVGTSDATLTYEQLRIALEKELKWLQPFFLGARSKERLLSNVIKEERVERLIRKEIFDEPLREAVELLKRLIDRRNTDPEAWLNLGIVYAALGEHDRGIDAIETALGQFEDQKAGVSVENTAPMVQQPDETAAYCEARYHLGRILCESALSPYVESRAVPKGRASTGDLDRAVSELREAVKGGYDDAAPYYYLGLAIRTRIEREQLVEAEKAWRTYLDKGASLGHRDEVQAFLESRRTIGTGTGSGWDPASTPWTSTGDSGTQSSDPLIQTTPEDLVQ